MIADSFCVLRKQQAANKLQQLCG